MKLRKIAALSCVIAAAGMTLAGCGGTGNNQTAEAGPEGGVVSESAPEGSFNTSANITVLSREDGSGTRGAFIELFGVEVKNEDGEKEDMTTVDATITNNTEVMMTTVNGNPYAIGYCSLGSLNESVKAVQIDGVDATTENVAAGTYQIARPFHIVVQDDLSDVANDFIGYILSQEGQAVVAAGGYIPISDAEAYAGTQPEGKVSVVGSSSVSPIMEKLKEAYEAVNPNASIEIQTNDSTTGITSAIEGTCDIGMASRDLKEEETGVNAIKIAMDGIAVIVNNENPITDLSAEAVRQIFTGEVTTWSEVE